MATEEQNPVKVVRVAELFMIEENDKIVDMEIGFTDAITHPQGAVHTLDLFRNALNSSGWVTKAVMSANNGASDEAPVPSNEQATKDGNADDKKTSKN